MASRQTTSVFISRRVAAETKLGSRIFWTHVEFGTPKTIRPAMAGGGPPAPAPQGASQEEYVRNLGACLFFDRHRCGA